MPQDRDHLACPHIQVDVVQHFGTVGFVVKTDVLEGDQRFTRWVQSRHSQVALLARFSHCSPHHSWSR